MSTDCAYRAAFERLWDEKSSEVVSNGKLDHASALIACFLAKAKKRVVIFCKDLKNEVYDDGTVLSALESALSRGIEITVLVQFKPATDSKFAARLKKASDDHAPVHFWFELPKAISSIEMNFAYADNNAYRFERNRMDMKAVASAWNTDTVKLLQDFASAIIHAVSPRTTPVAGIA